MIKGDVHISVDGTDLSNLLFDEGRLRLRYGVPMGSRASLNWSQFKAIDQATGITIPYRLNGADIAYFRSPSIREMLHGNPTSTHIQITESVGSVLEPGAIPSIAAVAAKDESIDYWLTFQLQGKVPDRFDFRVPDMVVNGLAYTGVDLRFQRTLGAACVIIPIMPVPHI